MNTLPYIYESSPSLPYTQLKMTVPNTSGLKAQDNLEISHTTKNIPDLQFVPIHALPYNSNPNSFPSAAGVGRLTVCPSPITSYTPYTLPSTPVISNITRTSDTPELVYSRASPALPVRPPFVALESLQPLSPADLVIQKPKKRQTRALNSYMIYRTSVVHGFKHSGLSSAKITAVISDTWKAMSKEQKAFYEEKSREMQSELDALNGCTRKRRGDKKDKKQAARRFVDCSVKVPPKKPRLETYPVVPSNAPASVTNASTVYAQYVQGCQNLLLSVSMPATTAEASNMYNTIQFPENANFFNPQ